MSNKIPEIAYQPGQVSSNVTPVTQVDVTPALAQEHQRTQQQMNANLQQMSINARTHLQNVKDNAFPVAELAKFSKTLTSIVDNQVKEMTFDKEASEMFDALTGGYDFNSPQQRQDDAQVEQGREQADNASSGSSQLESRTGDSITGQAAFQQLSTPQSVRYTSEKARLMNAQVSYGSWMSNYLNSNQPLNIGGQQMTIRQAVASGDSRLISAATASGRVNFIRSFGLQNVNKRQFVKMMAQTMISTDASLTGSIARETIKAQREELKGKLEGQGYQTGQTVLTPNVGTAYRDLAEVMWQSNAYATRGAANEAALDAMIEGMTDRGDVDGLRALLTTEKMEGNKGTQLRNQFGNKINDAIVKAENRQDEIVSRANKDIEADLYRELGTVNPDSPTAVAERDSIIESAAVRMEESGDYKGARELRSQRDKLKVDGSSQFANAELEQAIRDGEITSAEPIRQAELRGEISSSQAKERIEQLNGANDTKVPSNRIATALIGSYTKRFGLELGAAVGLKKDAMGNYLEPLAGQKPLLTTSEAAVLEGQAKAEIIRVSNQLLRENPDISDAEIQGELTKRLEAWWKAETQTAGGKFQLNDLIDARNADPTDVNYQRRLTDAQKSRLKDTVGMVGDIAADPVTGTPNTTPRDLTKVRQLGGFNPATKGMFNPLRRDKVFTSDELDVITKSYEKDGDFTNDVVTTADQLGMTPLALIQQQRGAYGLPPVDYKSQRSSSTAPPSAVEGTQMLMREGLPARGAAWLSGNIQAESAWRGQRKQWVLDDGAGRNGGILSWNRGRLQALESRFGKPSTQIPIEDQVSFLVEELRTRYPDAYRIFRNPHATDRQLIRASKIFIGYDDVNYDQSHRYNTARSLARKFN